MIEFTIPGKPCAVQSVRFTQRGIKYQPKRVTEWKSLVRMAAAAVKPETLLVGPVCLYIHAYFQRPQKYCSKKWAKVDIPCTARPDVDNICKGIADSLSGVLWKDDAQVVDVRILKDYAWVDEAPYTIVRVQSLEDV